MLASPPITDQSASLAEQQQRFEQAAHVARAAAQTAAGRVSRLALLRLVSFILLTIAVIYLFAEGYWPAGIGLIVLGLVGFNRLIGMQEHATRAEALQLATASVAEREVRLQSYDFSEQDGGQDFADARHPYSGDLDVFGRRSLFAQFNVTASLLGRHALARYLTQVLAKAEHMHERQAAVVELRAALDWRLAFGGIGRLDEGKDGGVAALDRLRAWMREPPDFQESWWPAVFWVLSLVNLAWLASFAYLPFGVALLGYAPTFFLLYRCKARVDHVQAQTEEAVAQLRRSGALLTAIETQSWQSPLLVELATRLKLEQSGSGAQVSALAQDVRQLAVRANPFVLLLNLFSLWELRYARRIEAWKAARQQEPAHKQAFPAAAVFGLPSLVTASTPAYLSTSLERNDAPDAAHSDAPTSLQPSQLDDWLLCLGAFDALQCLGAVAFRWPDWSFPEVVTEAAALEQGKLSGTGMHHPLLAPKHSVSNHFESPVRAHVSLLTGSNMAGKSTLLRTIGLQLVLAQIGSVVPAQALRLAPLRVYTSMRTQDDLHEGASAFYAELQRLSLVVEATQDGEERPVFFLLDEILKGTNSDDRNAGGRALIRQLLRHGGAGVVATHDLGLGELADELPNVSTLRLEVETDAAGELYFDYTVKPGLAQSRNASALMRRLGLGIEDDAKREN